MSEPKYKVGDQVVIRRPGRTWDSQVGEVIQTDPDPVMRTTFYQVKLAVPGGLDYLWLREDELEPVEKREPKFKLGDRVRMVDASTWNGCTAGVGSVELDPHYRQYRYQLNDVRDPLGRVVAASVWYAEGCLELEPTQAPETVEQMKPGATFSLATTAALGNEEGGGILNGCRKTARDEGQPWRIYSANLSWNGNAADADAGLPACVYVVATSIEAALATVRATYPLAVVWTLADTQFKESRVVLVAREQEER